VNFIEKYIEKQKKKSLWAWIGDILFAALVIGLLIPSTRTPIMVFMKKITMFSPSVSADDNYGQLTKMDYQWQLLDENGRQTKLSDYKDKPIFINFWATWCPPCIAEMPAIDNLQEEYSDRVTFLLVSYEDHAITQKFLKSKALNTHTFQALSKEPELLSSSSIPITFIIDKQGQIVVKKTGSSQWDSDSVKELLDQLLTD
jgi:thiol-disulfide isomerase/thioredoxin